MKSDYLKAALSCYFRFQRQSRYIATEVGRYCCDFMAVMKDQVIEVEIKVSKSDLRNDFKKDKHRIYADKRSYWTPHQFYFAVPEELVEYAVSQCVDKPYGVMKVIKPNKKVDKMWRLSKTQDEKKRIAKIVKTYEEVENIRIVEGEYWREIHFTCIEYLQWKDRVRVVKKAKKLHDRPIDRRIKQTIVSRLSSEMANLRTKLEAKAS